MYYAYDLRTVESPCIHWYAVLDEILACSFVLRHSVLWYPTILNNNTQSHDRTPPIPLHAAVMLVYVCAQIRNYSLGNIMFLVCSSLAVTCGFVLGMLYCNVCVHRGGSNSYLTCHTSTLILESMKLIGKRWRPAVMLHDSYKLYTRTTVL